VGRDLAVVAVFMGREVSDKHGGCHPERLAIYIEHIAIIIILGENSGCFSGKPSLI
jgi:hypothetical protein